MGSDTYKAFVKSSYALLQDYSKKGRYYHTLLPNDNSPVVIHKQTNQLTTVLKGNGKVVLNGEEKIISSGQTVFIEAGTLHQFLVESSEMVLFHIHVPDTGRDEDRYIVEGEDYNRFG